MFLDPTVPNLGLRFPHIEEEHKVPATLTFQGTLPEISIGLQFFAWIAATFRPPKPRKLSCSTVTFTELPGDFKFSLKLSELWSLEDRQRGTCWKALFPSSVMAYGFPVRSYLGCFGLCIPVKTMFELSDMLSDTTIEDEAGNDNGVYFDGDLWTLYPTGYSSEEHTVQWHIVRRTTDEISNAGLGPGQDGPDGLLRKVDLDTMANATAILGYCQRANVQLGTHSRLAQYEKYCSSGARPERGCPEASLGTVSFTGNALGRFMTGWTVNLKYRKGLIDARKKDDEDMYFEVLRRAATQPVILFDTQTGMERAWMVPQLSLVLDLFNFWAFCQRETDEEFANQVQYAKAGPDGGKMAMDVLSNREYASQVAIKSGYKGEPELRIGAMIKRINSIVEARRFKNAESDEGAPGTMRIGQTPITGWDWMELIPEFSKTPSFRRNARSKWHWFKRSCKPNWLDLANKLPLFLGQNIGEVLEPAQTSMVCDLWYPLPGGLEPNYLAASIRCLESLSKQCGAGKDVCKLFDGQVWTFKDASIFEPCVGCMLNPTKCTKQPQSLHKERTKDILPVLPSWRDGAVIFGVGRKPNPGISLGYWESERGKDPADKKATKRSHDGNSTVEDADSPATLPVVTSIRTQNESSHIAELNLAATNQTSTVLVKHAHVEWAITCVRNWWYIFVILVLTMIIIMKDNHIRWERATFWVPWSRDWLYIFVILALMIIITKVSHIRQELGTFWLPWLRDWWQTVVMLLLAFLLLQREMYY